MNKNFDNLAYKWLDWIFFIGSLILTLLTFLAFLLAFKGNLNISEFKIIGNFYWPSVMLYAMVRKIRLAKCPGKLEQRRSEMIMAFWLLVILVSLILTLGLFRENFPLMAELGYLYILLLGILVGGKAVETVINTIFNKK